MIRESVKESFRDPASASVVPREISAASGVFLSEIIYKSNNFESFCRGMFCSIVCRCSCFFMLCESCVQLHGP